MPGGGFSPCRDPIPETKLAHSLGQTRHFLDLEID